MNTEIINWLLDGPAWIKYAVELQLLGLKPDIGPVLQNNTIVEIVERLKSHPFNPLPMMKL